MTEDQFNKAEKLVRQISHLDSYFKSFNETLEFNMQWVDEKTRESMLELVEVFYNKEREKLKTELHNV